MGTPQEDVAIVRAGAHFYMAHKMREYPHPNAPEITMAEHVPDQEGCSGCMAEAALARLEQRLARQADAIRQARTLASHNAERHTGFVHIGRILAAAEPGERGLS